MIIFAENDILSNIDISMTEIGYLESNIRQLYDDNKKTIEKAEKGDKGGKW